MGWKLSMIIIENPQNFRDEKLLLKKLGFKDYEYQEDTTLDECMYPQDELVSIDYYNGNIIVCDDIQMIGEFLTDELIISDFEKNIVELFPNSEIIAVCCLSPTNFHTYIVIKNGEKIRIKLISANDELNECGELLEEEKEIYNKAIIKNEEKIWIFPNTPDEEFKEYQLMEEFTFSIIKRRLGVYISGAGSEELLDDVIFKKYYKK